MKTTTSIQETRKILKRLSHSAFEYTVRECLLYPTRRFRSSRDWKHEAFCRLFQVSSHGRTKKWQASAWVSMLLLILLIPASASTAVDDWKVFKEQFPFHLQTLALGPVAADGSRTLIISEPPPGISLETMRETLNGVRPHGINLLKDAEIVSHCIGVDGWVKGVVATVPAAAGELTEDISSLSSCLYGTSYKAQVLRLPAAPVKVRSKLDISVGPQEIDHWFNWETRLTALGGGTTNLLLSRIFASTETQIFYHPVRGLVAWWIPRGTKLSTRREVIRQFAVDTDLLVGGMIQKERGVLLIGRERTVPLHVVPPLRAETLILLANVAEDGLVQSYERNYAAAGQFEGDRQWAPVLLSPELRHTEFGSLLNMTDQVLKGWTMAGLIKYDNFDKYPNPDHYPFSDPDHPEKAMPLVTYLEKQTLQSVSELIFNWNTVGAGYSLELKDTQIYALNRTGALPVTYIPSGLSGATGKVTAVKNAMEAGYRYYAELQDPNLAKVCAYTAFYQLLHEARKQGAWDGAEKVAKAEQPEQSLRKLLAEALIALKKDPEKTGAQWAKDGAIAVAGYRALIKDITIRQMLRTLEALEHFSAGRLGEALKNIPKKYASEIPWDPVKLKELRELRQFLQEVGEIRPGAKKNSSPEKEDVADSDPDADAGDGTDEPDETAELMQTADWLRTLDKVQMESVAEELNPRIDETAEREYLAETLNTLSESQIENLVATFDKSEGEKVRNEKLTKLRKSATKEEYSSVLLLESVCQRAASIGVLPPLALAYRDAVGLQSAEWIKTPTIVISSATGELAGGSGGHNVDAAITAFQAIDDGTTKPGSAAIIARGGRNMVVIHPSDIPRIQGEVRTLAARLGDITRISGENPSVAAALKREALDAFNVRLSTRPLAPVRDVDEALGVTPGVASKVRGASPSETGSGKAEDNWPEGWWSAASERPQAAREQAEELSEAGVYGLVICRDESGIYHVVTPDNEHFEAGNKQAVLDISRQVLQRSSAGRNEPVRIHIVGFNGEGEVDGFRLSLQAKTGLELDVQARTRGGLGPLKSKLERLDMQKSRIVKVNATNGVLNAAVEIPFKDGSGNAQFTFTAKLKEMTTNAIDSLVTAIKAILENFRIGPLTEATVYETKRLLQSEMKKHGAADSADSGELKLILEDITISHNSVTRPPSPAVAAR